MNELEGSTPSVSDFDPLPMQMQVIRDIRNNFDYSLGVHECLLSGSIGSTKSLLMAHLVITHCLQNTKARGALCRLTMPDLKDTILLKVLDHLDGTENLIEGKHWEHNVTKGQIDFCNGSQIISRSWADQKFKKFRSVELSCAVIEELTENNDRFKDFYPELKMRVGRLPHVKENFIISATNPDSPSHWAYKYFIQSTKPTIHVYYSKTKDNPFLPPQYIEQLENDLDPKMARRMLHGEWIEISKEVIYYAYSEDRNFKKDSYKINPYHPIHISHDFNIGHGKPMSACLFQYLNDEFHVFGEVILEGMRTLDIYDELAARGVFDTNQKFFIHGDATGKRRDTRSIHSDYDIIRMFLSNYRNKQNHPINFEIKVPMSNPPIKLRHNRVNAYCLNEQKRVRLFVYKEAPTVNDGMRLTALKPGGNFVEDDSKKEQHVTTALGYGIISCTQEKLGTKEFDRWNLMKF